MSSPSESSPVDGPLSPVIQPSRISAPDDHQSDSDLSDVQDDPIDVRDTSPSPDPNELTGQLADGHDFADSNESSDDNASEDADFDMEDEVPTPSEAPVDDADDAASTSHSSSRSAPKRKAVHNEDAYIKANPELYGLRRSGRATQQRLIVESDDESDSDVVPTARRNNKRRRLETSQPPSKRATPIPQVSVDDSDSDTYGGARAKSLLKKARRDREAQPSTNLYAEKRWSSRRAAQVQQGMYEESDVDEDEDASELTPNYLAEVVDDSPYIEKVVRHRIKAGLELGPDASRNDFEYYIKWQGKSHVHDTWETTESLRGFRGFRRLENYYRKVVEYELDIKFGDDIAPESKEQYLLDRERDEEALEDYTKVERVVAVRDTEDDETEYFIKWKGLTYDECTWESASSVSPQFQDKIDQFLDRSSRSWFSTRQETSLNTRSKMRKLEKQPDYIKGGELRQFQLRGLNFLCLNWTLAKNVILADEMGLGKTVQSVSFLSWLRNDRGQEGPFLVVAPLSVIPAWCDTFNNWAPDLNYVVYLGPDPARTIIRDNELMINGNPKKPKFNVLLTSYDYILADWQFLSLIKWQVLAVDEAHRLKNRESQLYAKLFSFNVPCKILITGTPIQNNLAELSALLDFLNPGKVDIDGDLDSLAGNDAQEKLQELHKAIAPYILRRTKETVESDLPPKTEKIIRVELSDVQLEYYKNILTRNYAALSDASNGHKNSLLNIMMELKKISNHPYMFHGAEERVLAGSTRREDQIKGLIASSGKMMLLDQLLTKLRKDGHRVLIFSQMVRMLDILSDYLSLRGYKFQRLDGTISAGPRRMAINHFNAEDSEDFCFLLSTRAGGLGINLMTADTVIIFDSDWNPQADLQAMARAHRIGQKRPVNIYRLVSKETVEEEVLERARNKLLLEYLTIQAGVTDDGKAFREEFNKKGLKMDGPNSAEDIQLVLKMRSQKMFEQTGNQERLEQLDIDSILENAEVTKTKVDDKMNLSSGGIDWDNFMQITDVKVDDLALDWDQIIPADQLAVIKAEEEKRQHEEYLAKVAEESAPRRATIKHQSRNGESDRADRLAKKRQREQAQQREQEERRALLSDPKRPLSEKETRNLIRAFFRYGSIEDRGDELVQDARLSDRDRDFLKSILDDFVKASRQAMIDNNARLAEDERTTGKALTKKDKKAVLFDFGEVKKVNAETALDRPPQLRLLREVIGKQDDFKMFRLHDATKAANYTCPWGAKEDAMLLIGIDRYGFGQWTQIRDDVALEMADKFFLEEHRIEKKEERTKSNKRDANSPGAVHLVRRAEYLLSVLQAKYSNDAAASRAVANHHRTNKKLAIMNGHRRGDASGSGAASPAPAMVKKGSQQRDRDHHRSRSHAEDRGTPRPSDKRKNAPDDDRHLKRTKSDDKKGSRYHSPRPEKRKHRSEEREREHSHKRRRSEEGGHSEDRREDEQRAKALRRLEHLRRMGDSPQERQKDPDAMLWFLLKPVRANFENVLATTKEKVKSSKVRAKIFGDELLKIGTFLDAEMTGDSEALKGRFWDFLATLWPVDNTASSVTGDRLALLYKTLQARDREKKQVGQEDGHAVTGTNGTSRRS